MIDLFSAIDKYIYTKYLKMYLKKLLIVCLLGFSQIANSQSNLIFKHLTANEGLSISSVISVAQDSTGFMWFGAKYALNKYDGQSIKIYKNNSNGKNGIGYHEFIRVILTDRTNHLWIGSNMGLDRYDPVNDTFEKVFSNVNVTSIFLDLENNIWVATEKGLTLFEKGNTKNPIDIQIQSSSFKISRENNYNIIYQDHSGKMWLGTRINGLFMGTIKNHGFIIEKVYNKNNKLLADNYINCIEEDKENQIWIGTKYGGLNRIEPNSGKSINFFHSNLINSSIASNNIRKVRVAKDSSIWVATQNGLSIISPKTLTISNYRSDANSENSLSQNSLYDIVEDRQGCMWVGSYFGGVNIIYSNSAPFKVFKHSQDNNSISSNIISDIKEDRFHNLWIGTEAGGLNYYNRSTDKFTHYENNVNDKNSISSNLVKSILIDKQENIWVGTSLGGINLFSPKSKIFQGIGHDNKDSGILSLDDVNCMLEDNIKRFWVGTGKGLYFFEKENRTLKKISINTKGFTINNDNIYSLFEDNENNIWIGAENGIYKLANGLKELTGIIKVKSTNLLSDHINCFKQDSKGRIWLGTFQGGLGLYDKKNNRFKTYTQQDGLCSDNILGILEDDNGYLWLSTDKGLCKCNPEKHYYRNFNMQDGLPSNEFNIGSYLKTSNGEMFFGGYNGFVSFFPHEIKENEINPRVVFTGIKLFNNPILINGEDGILKKNINYTDTISFRHDQNIFTINFSCLNYIKPLKNSYAYKLEGFEKDWNYVNVPTATYTNLSAGVYVLLVKACNNDRVWNNVPTKLTIIILPPPWKTWWAYLIYTIVIGTIIYFITNFFRARAKLKKDLYHEHLLNERQEYVHQMKLEFFTNISHELRTPLTLIKGPIDMLLDIYREEGQSNKLLLNIKQNSDRLIRLVGELMDFRKSEAGLLVLHHSENDIVQFIKEIYVTFSLLAEKRKIDYQIDVPDKQVMLFFDKVQMEKVIFNLLSNTFKYVPDGGKITISVFEQPSNEVSIAVTDNGRGISEDNLAKIFDNFYQVDDQIATLGTGIGLAFSRSIVDMHKGRISASSIQATHHTHGVTCFTVVLLKGKEHLDKHSIIVNLAETNDQTLLKKDLEYFVPEMITQENDNDAPPPKHTLLVVEDNEEIRTFIKESFCKNFIIKEAENGKIGLEIALEEIPDIVISDVMMPEMNGMDLCSRLKNDERTCHIPVILLTARTAYIHQVNGLEIGADDYITKPFDVKILSLKIENLLKARENIRKKYVKRISIEPKFTDLETPDDFFIEKLSQLIEENISESDFGVEQLAKALFMSRSVLYKKVAALTDMTVADYIKTYRLKKAAYLIKQNKLSITDIAFELGFGNRKYFSLEFKKYFGVSPSAYNDVNIGD